MAGGQPRGTGTGSDLRRHREIDGVQSTDSDLDLGLVIERRRLPCRLATGLGMTLVLGLDVLAL